MDYWGSAVVIAGQLGGKKERAIALEGELDQAKAALASSKKDLVQKTKAFREVAEDERLKVNLVQVTTKVFPSLLRSYQLEIDHLSAKFAALQIGATEMVDFMKNLSDPSPILALQQNNQQRVQSLEAIIQKLDVENTNLKKSTPGPNVAALESQISDLEEQLSESKAMAEEYQDLVEDNRRIAAELKALKQTLIASDNNLVAAQERVRSLEADLATGYVSPNEQQSRWCSWS